MINGTVDDSGLDFIRDRIGICRMACGPAAGGHGGEILPQSALAGVLLLLFSGGLKLRLKSLARPEVLAGSLLHMLITGLVMGAALHWAFRLPPGNAFFLAVSLAFSSTVVVAKVLEGKRELRAFHG